MWMNRAEFGIKRTEDFLQKEIMGNHVMQTKIPQIIKADIKTNTAFYFPIVFFCFEIFDIFNKQYISLGEKICMQTFKTVPTHFVLKN